MRRTPEWLIQAAWWTSSVFATGAAWYFLSVKAYGALALSAVLAVAFALLAIYLHRRRDAADIAPEAVPLSGLAGEVRAPVPSASEEPSARVEMKELYRMAWSNPENKQAGGRRLVDISNAIRQAALDGDLPVWGRGSGLHALLEPVPQQHWREHWIDWIGCFLLTNGGEIDDLRPNANAFSYIPGQVADSGFRDLHVVRDDIAELLRRSGYIE